MNGSLKSKINKATARALNRYAQELQNEVINVTPLDTGELRRSIYSTTANQKILQVEIGSRGAIAPYNYWVHEIPKENYTTQGTGSKFLEKPFEATKHLVQKYIQEEVKKSD